MNEQREKKDRAWLLLLLLLPFGVLIMSVAGQIALSQPPTWRVRAAMDSALDPYLALTSESFGQISPVRGEIMTAPAWLNTLESSDGTPVSNPTQIGTQPPGGTATASPPATVTLVGSPTPIGTATTIPTETVVPTATIIYPPPTSTKQPPPDPTDTPIPTPVTDADLSITKDDGVTTYTPGGSVTYTIVVSNAGPGDVTGATVSDNFPAQIASVSWTCATAGGASCTASGSGNINQSIDLPSGSSVTYTVTANISAAASGDMTNTATVALPAGMTDPNNANNTAQDVDTEAVVILSADLSINKTDGTTTYTPGKSVTYTITAANAGPDDAMGATVTDNFPAQVSSVNWTCVGTSGASCSASGSGNINDTVNLPAGGFVTYTVTANIHSDVSGSMTNTAIVSAPSGVVDSNSSNNSNADTDTPAPEANLSITKTDSVTTYVPGESVTYTITASNAGPSDISGATVADTFPAQVSGTSWTCAAVGGATCSASGSGNISDSLDFPVGSSVTYSVTANIASSATGNMTNTAIVSVPAGASDPNTGNNSANDTDTPAPKADLSITKDDSVTDYTPGGSVAYSIVVSNAGPSDVSGATVSDTFPVQVASASWTCSATGSASCTSSGTGNLNDTINIPVGDTVTYSVTANISSTATGDMTNTATVSVPAGVTETNSGNNSAQDTDTQAPATPSIDLSITKTDGSATYSPGDTLTYTIVVTNSHASAAASGFNITDDNVPLRQDGSWSVSCTPSSGGDSCGTNASSGDDVAFNGASLSAGETLTVSITGRVSLFQSAPLVNTANIIIPGGASFTDPNLVNNSAQDTSNATLPSCDKTIAVSGTGNISLKSWDVTCLTFSGTDGVIISASNAAWTYLRWAGENEGGSSCGVYGKTIIAGSITDAYIDNNGASITLYAQPFFIDDTLNITSISDWTGGCP